MSTNCFERHAAGRIPILIQAMQLTFYDPGLGSQPEIGVFGAERAYRWLHNLVSQATGLGITMNIIDCYAAILRMWQPGDRVFLFGFSRGAYTVALCGRGPFAMRCADNYGGRADSPFSGTWGLLRKIAKEAVQKVYQHVSSPKDAAYIEQRKALALQFRQKYHSDVSGAPNVNPYFIGVFDTVAALGSYLFSIALIALAIAVLALISYLQSLFLFAFSSNVPLVVGCSRL